MDYKRKAYLFFHHVVPLELLTVLFSQILT